MAESAAYHMQDVKALIIDDQDAIRKAMRRLLLAMGIQSILECPDGRDALKALAKQPEIDLVLCDIYMKKVNGFEVLSYIRNRPIRADIPVILVTGEANKDDIVHASDMGADEYLLKPFQAEALMLKIQQVLNRFYSPPVLLAKLREGDLYMVAKQYRKAFGAYQEALILDPESKRAKYCLAVSLFHRHMLIEALEILAQNSVASPSYYKNYALEADIYLKLETYDKAQAALERELSYNPKQPERQLLLAKLLLEHRKDQPGALSRYRQTLLHSTRNPEALLGIARAFALGGNLTRALSYLRKHRRYYPQDSASLTAMHNLCVAAGETAKAEGLFKEEIQAHSSRLDTYVALAKLYMATKRVGEAQQVLHRLLKIDPEYNDGIKLKADIAMQKGQASEALLILEELAKKGPDLQVLLRIAECQQSMAQHQASINTLHRALFLQPDEAQTTYLLAIAYQKTKQPIKALILFQAASKAGVNVAACVQQAKLCTVAIEAKRR